MCGIAGFVGRGDESVLAAMTQCLVHRGPDGEGRFIDRENAVYLGHRRLAVIDIALGQQPMWNEDGLVGIVFNGMIYNHASLRRELVKCGHVFRSHHSDTEVIIHGWEQWGFELLERLNGMFAFALLDRRTSRLILARDRFGEKPLFYGTSSHGLVFASELSAVLAHPSYSGAPMDAAAIRKYLAYGFFPAPLTPYRTIAKLPHGHALEYDLGSGESRVRRYWRFTIEDAHPPDGNAEAWAEELDGLLSNSVALRLDSDRPLGIFLSGGLDSSTILSHAAEHRPADSIESFAIGFQDKSFDEAPYAAQMAVHVGSRHRSEICEIDTIRALLADLPAIIDEPLGDSSILPTYLLCKFARQHVTVALSGDGGDELFAGYDPFKILAKADLYHRLVPRPIHSALAALAARMPPSNRNMSLDFKLNRGLRGLGMRSALWNPVWLGPASPSDITALMSEPVDVEDLYGEAIAAWDSSPNTGLVDRTLEFYTNFYLADDIMVKSDRSGMRNGLEVRAPFLDNDVVDFARRLPATAKLNNGVTKWVLRQASAKRLPKSLLKRPKKGFGIPLARWLRDLPEDVLGSSPLIDSHALHRLWQDHHDRRRDHRGALWCALTLRQ